MPESPKSKSTPKPESPYSSNPDRALKEPEFPYFRGQPKLFQGNRGDKKFEVSIGSLDDPSITVFAQYRPKELGIDQTVPWTKHISKNQDGNLQLEFSGAEGRTSTLELFFDASEVAGDSVNDAIETLATLANVREQKAHEDRKKDEMKRPHHCVLVFGNIYKNKPFHCVIESMSTKFTMFSPEGDPIRATVNLKLRENDFFGAKDQPKNQAKPAKTK
jgi:Contractile injection system tube protein